MGRFAVLVVVLATVLVITGAQLTFSTGWGNGKRSVGVEGGADVCSPEESLFLIYKLIQVRTYMN